jgi:hypothetical protein
MFPYSKYNVISEILWNRNIPGKEEGNKKPHSLR